MMGRAAADGNARPARSLADVARCVPRTEAAICSAVTLVLNGKACFGGASLHRADRNRPCIGSRTPTEDAACRVAFFQISWKATGQSLRGCSYGRQLATSPSSVSSRHCGGASPIRWVFMPGKGGQNPASDHWPWQDQGASEGHRALSVSLSRQW